jgi:Fic family protein
MPRTTGTYDGEAFLPSPLPPSKPPLLIDGVTRGMLVAAEHALARLEVAAAVGPAWLADVLARAGAVAACRIDGVEMTLLGSYAEEHPEVARYIDALAHARKESDRGLSLKVLHGAHRRLLKGDRAARPGDLRRTSTAGAPPASALAEAMGALEAYCEGADPLPPLVRVGLVLAQLDRVQPYAAGNARVAHLVVSLLLARWAGVARSVVPFAGYAERYRGEYQVRLAAIQREGDWEGWIAFFLEGIRASAEDAIALAGDLVAIAVRDRDRALAAPKMTVPALRLLDALPRGPVVTIAGVASTLDVTRPVADKAVGALVLLRALTAKKRGGVTVYRAFVDRLRAAVDP